MLLLAGCGQMSALDSPLGERGDGSADGTIPPMPKKAHTNSPTTTTAAMPTTQPTVEPERRVADGPAVGAPVGSGGAGVVCGYGVIASVQAVPVQ